MGRTRAGFTLVEIMIVVVVGVLLTIMGIPKFRDLRDRQHVEAARQQLSAAIATARASAVQKGRIAYFSANQNIIGVRATIDDAGTQTAVVQPLRLDSLYRVTLTSNTTDTLIRFDSRGLVTPRLSETRVYRIALRSKRDSVCVTTIGQVLRRGCSL